MSIVTQPQNSELVVNWHMTEVCNFSCQYCYAKWGTVQPKEEISRSYKKTYQLLKEINEYFNSSVESIRLRNQMNWNNIRLNLAGGEPLLFERQFNDALDQASELGMTTSIITNGSTLTKEKVKTLSPKLSWLGISIDSINQRTNAIIGRQSKKGEQIDLEALTEIIEEARLRNPLIQIKINTVVNDANHLEDFSDFISTIRPEKWKVLKMLPVITSDLSVSEHQYKAFLLRHKDIGAILRKENNNDMSDSYIMIDPLGRLYQNGGQSNKGDYIYSAPITDVGAERAFAMINFDAKKFAHRYS